jgi:hypothetical protein
MKRRESILLNILRKYHLQMARVEILKPPDNSSRAVVADTVTSLLSAVFSQQTTAAIDARLSSLNAAKVFRH